MELAGLRRPNPAKVMKIFEMVQQNDGSHAEVVLSNLASIGGKQISLTSVATAQAGSAKGAA